MVGNDGGSDGRWGEKTKRKERGNDNGGGDIGNDGRIAKEGGGKKASKRFEDHCRGGCRRISERKQQRRDMREFFFTFFLFLN